MSEISDRQVTRELPVKLTESEMADVARAMGRADEERRVMESHAKVENDRWKDRIKGLDARISDLASKAHLGMEARPVKCLETYDYRLGEVRVVRTDTGEALETRPMTSDERQPTLPGAEPGATSKGGRKKKPAANDDGAAVDPDSPPTDVTDPQAVLDAEKH